MADYIERQRLKEAILADCQHLSCFDESFFDMVMINVDEIPAANVQEDVQGEWVFKRKMADGGEAECSICGKEMIFNSFRPHTSYHFCPNCGARMTGGGKQ